MPTFQSTRWCFTINNPTQQDRDNVGLLSEHALRKYLVVGREVGETGTPHLQGFLVLSRALSRTAVSTHLPRAYLAAAVGTSQQAAAYCKKDGDFDEYGTIPQQRGANGVLEPLYEWGTAFINEHGRAPTSPEIARAHPTAYIRYPRAVRLFEHQAPQPDLRQGEPRDWQLELEALLEDDPDDRQVIFYVDNEGNKGKSWFQAWYLTQHPETTQILSAGKRDDIAHAIDKTKSVFFFNIARGGMEFLQYTILEQLKDRMVFSPKYNSQTKLLIHTPHVVVFCNEMPDMYKMSEDRYNIIELN